MTPDISQYMFHDFETYEVLVKKYESKLYHVFETYYDCKFQYFQWAFTRYKYRAFYGVTYSGGEQGEYSTYYIYAGANWIKHLESNDLDNFVESNWRVCHHRHMIYFNDPGEFILLKLKYDQ
jgi:hypothetical protein